MNSATLTHENTPAALHPWLKELNALHAVYVVVMAIKAERAKLAWPDVAVLWCVAVYGYLRDVWFNLTTATRIFRDPARELTVTARLKRYRKTGTPEQQALAEFLCDQVLDGGDPDGDHC